MGLNDATLALAQAVADGSDVDWDRAESDAVSPQDRALVQQLRQLARLGAAARAELSEWGPLEIRRPIGRGSFGSVYLAWDRRLERDVALKLLDGVVTHEGAILARVRHANVVTIHGADVFEGRAGLWMEFIEGQTLKAIVERAGRFGAAEATIIGCDLCRALAAVHREGLLHRDVKAQNVMREAGGRIVLMDFGTGGLAGTDLPLAGTPVYLAPEVIDGQAPSIATDIYALGVLLFYLATAAFPVEGGSFVEIRERHARGQRQRLRDVRPDLPVPFVRAVDRMTAVDPHERPASAGAAEALLEAALHTNDDGAGIAPVRPSTSDSAQRVPRATWHAVVATAVLGLLATGGWWWSSPRPTPAPAVDRPSVAILPFRNLSPEDPAEEYLTEGLTDDLSAQLATLKDVRVIAGVSTRRYRSGAKTNREIGTELGVGAILVGSIRRDADRVRIVSRLEDAQSGAQLWSGSFERELKDVFIMQSEVARKIAVALKGELSAPEAQALERRQRTDFETARLYAKGRYYLRLRTEDGLNQSVQYFNQAIARDAGYAPAHAGLADSYTALGTYGILPRAEAFARAADAARRAVALDESLAEGHAALGYALKNRFEWTAAETSFRRALALKPAWPTAHHWYSIFLTQHGRFPEAITEAKAAIALDPLSIGPNMQFAAALLMARRYADAIAQYERALEIDPGVASAYRSIAQAKTYLGEYADARVAFDRAARATPAGAEDQEYKAAIGYLDGRSNRRDEALRVAKELSVRYEATGEQLAASVAAIHAGCGGIDEALRWLERAVDGRDPEVAYLKVDPRWDPLRSDPRFAGLLDRLGFTR